MLGKVVEKAKPGTALEHESSKTGGLAFGDLRFAGRGLGGKRDARPNVHGPGEPLLEEGKLRDWWGIVFQSHSRDTTICDTKGRKLRRRNDSDEVSRNCLFEGKRFVLGAKRDGKDDATRKNSWP